MLRLKRSFINMKDILLFIDTCKDYAMWFPQFCERIWVCTVKCYDYLIDLYYNNKWDSYAHQSKPLWLRQWMIVPGVVTQVYAPKVMISYFRKQGEKF